MRNKLTGIHTDSAKKLLMFDFDGTICDTLSLFHRSFTVACHRIGIESYDLLESFLGLFDHNLYESMADDGIDESTIRKIQSLLGEELTGKLDSCTIFSGLTGVLRRLRDEGDLLYVITSSISTVVEEYLERQGVDVFSDVLGADKGRSKIEKIGRITKKHPEYRAYYVGDTVGDMLEGEEAGAITVGAAWGWHGADKLAATDADIVSPDPLHFYDDIVSFTPEMEV